MTPTWTGHPGDPVPEALRHALVPCGERQRHCAGCGGYWWVEDGLPGERELCPAAVAQRLAELEAHEASIHKAVDRSRRGTVRWLEHVARTSMGHAHEVSRQAFAFSARIERGDDIRWCEANPETTATEEIP